MENAIDIAKRTNENIVIRFDQVSLLEFDVSIFFYHSGFL
jgi:hypothetical protein